MLSGLFRDLLHAARSLARARAFTLVCVVSLGIGMAPVIAIPYAARLTRLTPPGVKTDELVQLVTTTEGPHQQSELWSYPDYVDLRDADTGLTLIGWIGGQSVVTFPPAGLSRARVSTMFVPPNYFKTLGVRLARGAGFDAAEDNPVKAEPVVVLGYRFWQNRLAAAPDIIGNTITIDATPHVVVGIAPQEFVGHIGVTPWDLYVPLERHPSFAAAGAKADLRNDRSKEWLNIHGRLNPGVTIAQASAAVAGVTARLANAYPSTNEFRAGIAGPYDPFGILFRPQVRRIETAGFVVTGIVLLIICLNISGMMQVRGAMRERELSIRQAVGATRWRLARYLLSESIVLACAGGTLASIVIVNVSNLLPWLTNDPAVRDIPPQILQALRVSVPMVAFCFGLCLVTSLAFGWVPALRFSRPAIISSIKDDAGAGGGLRAGRVHRWASALQMAIAVPLLVFSGQGIIRVRTVATQDLGFASENLFALPLKLDGLPAEQAWLEVHKASDAVAHADGVASMTVADGLPLDIRGRVARAALQPEPGAAPRFTSIQVTRVGDAYLETMGIPLVRGRGFTVDDGAGAEPVTVISKSLADKLTTSGDVIGKRLLFGADERTQQIFTIVGVTADFPTAQMDSSREQLLLPLAQHPGVAWDGVTIADELDLTPKVFLVTRAAAGGAGGATAALESVGRGLDKNFLPANIVTGRRLRKNGERAFLIGSMMTGGAGAVILLLAALGIYGVVGLTVAARTREIAVRAALGATRRRLLAMILQDVIKLVLPGVIVGALLMFVLNRLNPPDLGVAPTGLDPIAYVVGPAIAVLVAVLASLAPARRAASVPPMVAMRAT